MIYLSLSETTQRLTVLQGTRFGIGYKCRAKLDLKNSYEMQLVNEFILSLLYFAFPYQGVTVGAAALSLGAMVLNDGKCFF